MVNARDVTDNRQMRERLHELPFALPGDPAVRIGASVGVDVALPTDLPDDVLRRADTAMYRVKRNAPLYPAGAVTGTRENADARGRSGVDRIGS